MRPGHWRYTIPLRWRSLFGRGEADRELEEELREHVEQKTEEYVAQGLPPNEARRQALLEMGGIEKRKEECREARGVTWIQDLIQDLHFGLRMLRKSPGFTTVAVLTLALGIGAGTAIFSVVRAALLRPLPYRDPNRLVYISEFWPHEAPVHTVPSPDFSNWNKHDRLLDGLAAYGGGAAVNVDTNAGAEHVMAVPITANFFSLLGIHPTRGRAFVPEEDRPNGRAVVILTWQFWRDNFGSDPKVIGQTTKLDGVPYTIVGIAPKGFQFPDDEFKPQLFVPIKVAFAANWGSPEYFRMLRPLARLRRGVRRTQVRAELSRLVREASTEEPLQFARMREGMEVRVIPLHERLAAPSRAILMLLSASVAVLLILCCVNVAGLMVARSISRTEEFAVRAALGGSVSRLVRQVLNESVALAILTAPFAALVAVGAVRWLKSLAPAEIPQIQSMPIDSMVLMVAVFASLIAGLASGLWPAAHASRIPSGHVVKQARQPGGSRRHGLVQRTLVVVQIAMATILVISSGLLSRSLINLILVNPGFDPHHLLTARLSLSGNGYAGPEQQAAFCEQLIDRLRSLPGVHSVAVGSGLPTLGWGSLRGTTVEGQPEAPAGLRPDVPADVVSVNYFEALHIPLMAGREFNEADRSGSPEVAIVNQSFVRRFFPDGSPLGKRVQTGAETEQWRVVVGVVGDVHQRGPERAGSPEVYIPYLQEPTGDVLLVLRTAGNPIMWTTPVRSAVRSLDSSQPLYDVASMEARVSSSIAPEHFDAELVGALAALAVLLGAIGIYGIVSFSTARRTHEIGIRVALGAHRWQVGGGILAQGLQFALFGIAIGVAGALASSRLLAAFLYGVSGNDPLTLAGTAMLIVFVTLLACYIPARRAMRVDPTVALRYE